MWCPFLDARIAESAVQTTSMAYKHSAVTTPANPFVRSHLPSRDKVTELGAAGLALESRKYCTKKVSESQHHR
jgi:hypothetical protein